MKQFLPAILLLSFLSSYSQQNYWQQQVDYKIDVTLNDTLHELNGFITINYLNNSPNTLNFIYLHLWPNAYSNLNTPLADQLLENGERGFRFSKPSQRGYMDKLDFKLNNETCEWKYDTGTTEICKIMLKEPLKNGQRVSISTPFHVKLPDSYSRMGHVGQSYQITQWYPKPAVYDKNGWHPIPYLDQGEFYSEYGSFDVSITLPKNYVVGATGDLQDEAEMLWLDIKADETKKIKNYDSDMKFPASAKETKTIHYKQKNIHDFGWFADKRYHVLKGEVELPYSKRKVVTWTMFTNQEADLWTKAPEYIHDAIYYYSLWVGEYPYQQVTAVDGTISAGGGMEYPNVTIIGHTKTAFALDDVITHEVGHNWFYGMLGSNERDHAWMDEGINSYYEYRYLAKKYPTKRLLGDRIPNGVAKFFDVAQYKNSYMLDAGYQLMARENISQPIDIPSADFTKINYGLFVYGKTMLVFNYLEAYLGTEVMDKAMKKYFDTWQYKHPQPEDIRKILEEETGKNLSWFFDDLIGTDKKVDYKIVSSKTVTEGSNMRNVELSNEGEIISPVVVSVLKKDSVLRNVWVEGFTGSKKVEIDITGGDRIQIDPLMRIPEINRRNNTYILNKVAHKFEKLRFQFLGSLENQNRTQIFWAPYLSWNNYDKTQIGLALYSPFIPGRKFEYMVAPAFATGSLQLVGTAKLNYNIYSENIERVTVGISGKRFSYLLNPIQMFNKVEPYLNIELKKKTARSPYSQNINARTAIVWVDRLNPVSSEHNKETLRYSVTEARYQLSRHSTLNPFTFTATYRQNQNFIMLSGEADFELSYKRKGQGFFIRLFAGGFPLNNKSNSDLSPPLPKIYLSNGTTSLAPWLQQDYMFDETFLDRNGVSKYLNRQVALTGGAFRSITSFGSTSKFLASANFSSTILRVLPIRPFASAAVVLNDANKMDIAAEMGLTFSLVRNMLEIHLPLVTTKNIADNQKVLGISKWYQRFTFTFKIRLQKPLDIIKSMI